MNESNTQLMTIGDYRKKIILFAIPLFIGNLFQQMYNTADSLIVGNLLGAQALAAVSSVSSLVFLFVGFFQGFSTGAGVIIARYIGGQKEDETSNAVHTTVFLGILLSIVMTIIGYFLSPEILKLMGTPDDVFYLSKTYLQIYFLGFSGLVMYNTFTGILQAAGDSKHPLYYLVISSLMNVVLDIAFIGGFGMNVEGAAIATILSEILTAILAGARLMRTNSSIQLHVSKIKMHTDCLQQIVRYGFPTALQASVIDISNILIQSYINSFGSLAMAGIGASTKAEGFIFLPVTAFSMAMTTYISQNMGAEQYKRVKDGIRFGYAVALAMIGIFGAILLIFAPTIISFFNNDPNVIAYGTGRARICGAFYLLVGYSHISSAVCRGLGKPAAPMVIMLVCWCAVRVSVLFTIGQIYHNILLAYWIYPITWILSTITFFIYIHKVEKNVYPQNIESC